MTIKHVKNEVLKNVFTFSDFLIFFSLLETIIIKENLLVLQVRQYYVQFLYQCFKKNIMELKKVHGKATKIIKGMEHLPYEERLKRLGFSVWRGENWCVGVCVMVYN